MSYQIVRWDAVITENSDLPKPLAYFVPDINILEYARQNNFKFRVTIDNTGSHYDKQTFWAIMDKSSKVPNCRPNFFTATNLYVLTLYSTWDGYPKQNGMFKLNTNVISNMESTVDVNKQVSASAPSSSPSSTSSGLTSSQIAGIVLISIGALLTIILLVVLVRSRTR